MQQVNLYTEALKPKKVVLSLAHMAISVFALVLVLALISWQKSDSLAKQTAKTDKKAAQLEEVENTTDMLRDRVKRIVRDEQLVLTNEKLQRQLQQRERLGELLGASVTQGGSGFSDLLLGLGRQKVNSVWLTRIYFADSGNSIALEGNATEVKGVPDYLANLRNEAVFLGRNFDLFEMSEKDGLLEFILNAGGITVEQE